MHAAVFIFSQFVYIFMPDVRHPKFDHPKCGAKMQREN
jgi:hypothetical protein